MTSIVPRFEDWVALVFDREVTSPEWYWDDDDQAWDLPPEIPMNSTVTGWECSLTDPTEGKMEESS